MAIRREGKEVAYSYECLRCQEIFYPVDPLNEDDRAGYARVGIDRPGACEGCGGKEWKVGDVSQV